MLLDFKCAFCLDIFIAGRANYIPPFFIAKHPVGYSVKHRSFGQPQKFRAKKFPLVFLGRRQNIRVPWFLPAISQIASDPVNCRQADRVAVAQKAPLHFWRCCFVLAQQLVTQLHDDGVFPLGFFFIFSPFIPVRLKVGSFQPGFMALQSTIKKRFCGCVFCVDRKFCLHPFNTFCAAARAKLEIIRVDAMFPNGNNFMPQ